MTAQLKRPERIPFHEKELVRMQEEKVKEEKPKQTNQKAQLSPDFARISGSEGHKGVGVGGSLVC